MNTPPPLGWLKLTGSSLGYFNSFKDTKKHEDSCTKRFDNQGLMSTSLRILIMQHYIYFCSIDVKHMTLVCIGYKMIIKIPL